MLLSITEMLKYGEKFVRWCQGRHLQMSYDRTQAARLNPGLTDFLAQYHQYPLLTRAGVSYPVTALTCPACQREDIESILGRLEQVEAGDFLVNDSHYLDMLRAQKNWTGV